jgi:hypothetical protein
MGGGCIVYQRPPAHNHGLLPQDIISPETMDLLARHYKATCGKNPDEFDKAVKPFKPKEREECAAAYRALREYGFYPRGYTEDEYSGTVTIKWGIELKSMVVEKTERYLPDLPDITEDMTDEEKLYTVEICKEKARGDFGSFMQDQQDYLQEASWQ